MEGILTNMSDGASHNNREGKPASVGAALIEEFYERIGVKEMSHPAADFDAIREEWAEEYLRESFGEL